MQRINVIMRWAKAMGYRAGDNPAARETMKKSNNEVKL